MGSDSTPHDQRVPSTYPLFLVLHANFLEGNNLVGLPVTCLEHLSNEHSRHSYEEHNTSYNNLFQNLPKRSLPNFSHFFIFGNLGAEGEVEC